MYGTSPVLLPLLSMISVSTCGVAGGVRPERGDESAGGSQQREERRKTAHLRHGGVLRHGAVALLPAVPDRAWGGCALERLSTTHHAQAHTTRSRAQAARQVQQPRALLARHDPGLAKGLAKGLANACTPSPPRASTHLLGALLGVGAVSAAAVVLEVGYVGPENVAPCSRREAVPQADAAHGLLRHEHVGAVAGADLVGGHPVVAVPARAVTLIL